MSLEKRIEIFEKLSGLSFQKSKLKLKKFQKIDLEEYGLDGIYQGISMCLECLINEIEQKEEQEKLYFLSNMILKNKDILEYGARTGIKLEKIYNENPKSLTAIDTGFNYTFLNYYFKDKIDIFPNLYCINNKKYDIIYSYDVLEHIRHPQKIINKLIDLLKINGKLCIIAPFEDCTDDYPQHRKEHKNFNFKDYIIKFNFKIVDTIKIIDKYHITEGIMFQKCVQ